MYPPIPPTFPLFQFSHTLTHPLLPLLTEFNKRFTLDIANKVKGLNDSLSQVVGGEDHLEIALARDALERLTSGRYMV